MRKSKLIIKREYYVVNILYSIYMFRILVESLSVYRSLSQLVPIGIDCVWRNAEEAGDGLNIVDAESCQGEHS